MKKLIMWNVVTLDGRFEGAKPWDLSFHELVWGPELETLSLEQLQEASLLIFGKQTYLGMADYWTRAGEGDEPVAPLMNSIAKVVCSPTLETADWHNTTIVRNAVEAITRLKEETGGPMYVFGSGNLSTSLLEAGLYDEIRLCIAPTILGQGRHLFTDAELPHNLHLLEARPLENSGVILRYKVVK